jgi:hypothetical protein
LGVRTLVKLSTFETRFWGSNLIEIK